MTLKKSWISLSQSANYRGFDLFYTRALPLGCQDSELFVFFSITFLDPLFQHELPVLFTADIKPIFTGPLEVIIHKVADVSVIRMNQLSRTVPLPVYPWSCVLGPSRWVRVHALAVSLMLVPIPFVNIPIQVVVNPVAISAVLNPATLVTWTVWVPKGALAVFLALDILADVFGAVFEAIRAITVSFSVLILPLVSVSVWKRCFAVAMSLLVFISLTFVLLKKRKNRMG